jgi:inosine-uridine nucleoside N-ribohydrolase
VHVDTDFGGDPDDACAVAMLLGWPDVEISGITTNLDADGARAGCVLHVLRLAERTDIPVAAGARASLTTDRQYLPTLGDVRHWPPEVRPEPGPEEAARDLLAAGIDRGATVIAIGALTNLARLELDAPGRLRGVDVVVMGGWLGPPATGYPQWGPDMDFNIQCDTRAAEIVAATADVTLVPLPVAMKAQLRAAHLDRLRAAGSLGALLARQSAAQRVDSDLADLARANPALAGDLVNFHWDPVTAAVAVGWPGATVQEMRLQTSVADGVLRFAEDAKGRATRVVTDVDADDFAETWLTAVTAAATTSQ